ncbi:MAG: hypothetical protein ACE5LQ_01915 [Candidatus Bipolaricaulia bacterium]
MVPTLDGQAVRDWLAGQRAAAERIAAERVRFLLALTPERSLQTYLKLWNLRAGERSQSPSPLLLAMRRALAHLAEPDSGRE